MNTIDDLLVKAYSHWDDPKTLATVGKELQRRTRLDRARTVLARAVELDAAGDPTAWENYAFACYRDFMAEEGEKILRQGIEATDSDSIKASLAAFIDDEEEKKGIREELAASDDPEARAALAWPLVYEGKAGEAIDLVEGLHAEHPGNEGVTDTLIWVYLSAGQGGTVEGLDLHENGIPLAEQKIAEEPDTIYGHTMRAWMLSLEEDWDGLLAAMEETLAVFTDDETMMQYKARAHREKGDIDRAIQCYSRAIGMKPSYAGARVDLGKIYEEREQYDLAEEIFREIPVANPGYDAGPISLALFFGRRERWQEAEELFCATWPTLNQWAKGGMKRNPEVAAMLEREAVKKVVEA